MRAWVAIQTGTPRETLQLNPNAASPPPSAPSGTDIHIAVSHAALNPADLVHLRLLPAWLPFRQCPTPGLDFVGRVVAAGPDATTPVGSVVCGALGVRVVAFGTGSLAELISVPEHLVALKPEGLDDAQAAGMMGVAGQTAAVVMNEADVQAGQHVLVNGASGGVGCLVVQMAKAKGATVVGVCSAGNADVVRGLGADSVVDYTASPLEAQLAERFSAKDAQLDVIFDCVGSQSLFDQSPAYLGCGGKVINIVGGPSQGVVPFLRNVARPVLLGGTPRAYRLMGLMPSGELARQVAAWYEEGVVKEMPIDSEYAMDHVVEAFEKLMTKRARGKIIVRVQDMDVL